MPKKKRKSNSSTGVVTERTDQEKCAGNTVNLVNCQLQGLQIGDGNLLTISSGNDKPAHGHHKEQKHREAKEQFGIFFLSKLLERFHKPQPYTGLEAMVREELQSTDAKSFRDLSGWDLSDFLVMHKDKFSIVSRRNVKFIRLRDKKGLLAEAEKTTERRSSLTVGDHLAMVDACEITDDEFSNSDNDNTVVQDEWVPVKSKKNAKKEKSLQKESRINRLKAQCNFDEGAFVLLLRKGECDDILHVASFEKYKKDPFQFSEHVVSMWNTPQRLSSHIIIGIDSGFPKGIDSPLVDTVCQDMFKQSHFSTRPIFTCYNAYYNEKVFGVIEVGSSYGHGNPCAVTHAIESVEHPVPTDAGGILTRKGGHTVVIKTTDKDLSLVYQWFLGTTNSHGFEKACTEDKRVEANADSSCIDSASTDDRTQSSPRETTIEQFLGSVKQFKRGHFVLVSGDIPNTTKNLEALSRVPWLCVYDFDIFSCTDGLLNILQDKMQTTRHLRIRTWKEPVESISEHGTWWCFMRGRKEMPDSRTDLKLGKIETIETWMKNVKSNLHNNCESLARFAADYTVLTIVVLWPNTASLLPFMSKLLVGLHETLTAISSVVVCINKEPQTAIEKTFLGFLEIEFAAGLRVYRLSFEHLFQAFLERVSSYKETDVSYELPTNEGHLSSAIRETDAAWLREDFEVLYLHSQYSKYSENDAELENQIDTFYKGGNLHWFAWYNRTGSDDQIPIEREITSSLEDILRPHLEGFKTTVVSVFHEPGSGGTTLGQSVLWKFHQKVPSIHMKLRSGSSIDDLVKKVAFLHDRTGLPVLVLIDGEEDMKVKFLSKRLKYAILLFVKRFPYRISNKSHSHKNAIFLSGFVTPREATRLASKLGENVDEKKRRALERLKGDVCLYSVNHYLFEFGLTIHLHEFKGVVSFVEGYLQLENTPVRALSPVQKCLGYLALVYFYGQTSVPCQYFAALFGKPANYNMTLEEDFPHPISKFVVYDTNESKKNNIRICHYIVAKEILEQVLTTTMDRNREETLNDRACRNLSRFCLEFIEYASKKRKISLAISTTVRFVLTKTFIHRDERGIDDNDEQSRRKPVLSRLMSDIPPGWPLFTERLNVLQKLSSSFPEDPNFCAHLGRFYAFCRTDDEAEAERCFQKAISLCEKQGQGKKSEDFEDGIKLSLMHIYHMYGMVKQRSLQKYIKTKTKHQTDCKQCLLEIVPIAEHACELFKMCRDITPDTYQVYLFAYTGEIKARLQICDFVLRNFASESDEGCLYAFFKSDADSESKSFVHGSIPAIENLILDCYTDVDLVGEDISPLRTFVAWYNKLFQKQPGSILPTSTDNSISNRRLQIAAKKLKYGISTALTGIENIDNETVINEIIDLYEQNFACIQTSGLQPEYSKKDLERDCREWIFAIRQDMFKKNYSLEKVLTYVEIWHELVRSPLSTFYMFVIRSLLGFGRGNSQGKTECLVDAVSLQEQLSKMSHLIIRPKYPREWLGSKADGIKQLLPGKRYVGVCSDSSNDTSVNVSELAICKGTIVYPNTSKLSGFINFNLDLDSVNVFFIPKVVNLEGKRYVNQRVEFRLGFSIEHGFEAYSVKLLKRYGCSTCNAKLEFTSIDNVLPCACGNEVSKDDLNEVK